MVKIRSGFGRLKGLSMACAGCGFEIQADFAFCPRCGAAQRPAAAAKEKPDDADRRPVTVLFADLCGFTSLSERLDPEEVRTFQGVLFDSLGQAVSRRGGFVAKYLGDAVLALFGAPVAHEDDPERALAAALDMLPRARALRSARYAASVLEDSPRSIHTASRKRDTAGSTSLLAVTASAAAWFDNSRLCRSPSAPPGVHRCAGFEVPRCLESSMVSASVALRDDLHICPEALT